MAAEAPTDELDDRALLEAAASGDQDAFARLMERHEDRIFALTLRMTGERSDALDATQDAFIAAWRRASSFRGESQVGTWLYRIALNSTTDLLRKRARQPRADEAALAVAAEQPGPPLEEALHLRADLTEALRSLPEEYREAIVMHDIGGYAYEDIATATQAPLGTVKSRISRGRKLLAGMLEHPSTPDTSKDQHG